jgi:tetratricopeptide (TPR) repeat protein
MREALTEYPRHYKFMLILARAIQWGNYSINGMPDNDVKSKGNEEIISLCERILEDCTDNTIRYETMQILCGAYKDSGQKEKAIKTAREMPSYSATSDWLLSSLYEGDEQIYQKQSNITFCVYFAAHELTELSKKLGFDEKVAHLEAALKLYETIFYDGNALYYHTRILDIYANLANCYVQADTKKAMGYLLATEKHSVAADAITEEREYYTSIFANKLYHSTVNTLRSHEETWCEMFFKQLNDELYKPLHDNPDFIALKERLAKRNK